MPELIPQHGGYRKLKSFQMAQLAYDCTVAFCDRYIEKRSRTHDQMVQAARSGVQNIAEGSAASGTSKKFEIKLTNVARASLEELLLDYEDFLRHRSLSLWSPEHPALVEFKQRKPATLEEVRAWVHWAVEFCGNTDIHGLTQTDTDNGASPCKSVSVRVSPCLNSEAAANGILALINLAKHLLNRQIQRLEKDFLENGGFTEKLYNTRKNIRK
jgi:four helix bundle suffix protein